MGQCFANRNSVGVTETINLVENVKPQKSATKKNSNENVKLLISYCWSDKEAGHTLADAFTREKFRVWCDRDKMACEDEVHIAMESSDIVLICISESYLQCSECQREARYAFEQNLEIVVVNLNKGYVPNKWISQIIAGKRKALLVDVKNLCSNSFEIIKNNIVSFFKFFKAFRYNYEKNNIH